MRKRKDVTLKEFNKLLNRCPSEYRIGLDQEVKEILPRARLNTFLPLWGLRYQDLCTKRSWQIKAQTNYPNQLAQLRRFTEGGSDPIAPYLLARHEFDKWFAGGDGLQEGIRLLELASNLGNPRATADLASATFTLAKNGNQTADFARYDAALEKASEQGCAQATAVMDAREKGLYGNGLPRPVWRRDWRESPLLQKAIEQGSGQAACSSLYTKIAKGEPSSSLDVVAAQAKRLGDVGCVDTFMALAGMRYFKLGPYRRGPCATDRFSCLRSTLQKGALLGDPVAGLFLAKAMTEAELGGGWSNAGKAIDFYKVAQENGNPEAMAQLGWFRVFGQYGTMVEKTEGRRLCEQAHQLGDDHGSICVAFLEANPQRSRELTLSAEKSTACTTSHFVMERIDRAVPFAIGESRGSIVRKIKRNRSAHSALKRDRARLLTMLRTSTLVPSRCINSANELQKTLKRL